MRTRSAAYRARRLRRHTLRRMRMGDNTDYLRMLERTPGYCEMLERHADYERMEALALEWDTPETRVAI